jgi:hypothetical protein
MNILRKLSSIIVYRLIENAKKMIKKILKTAKKKSLQKKEVEENLLLI